MAAMGDLGIKEPTNAMNFGYAPRFSLGRALVLSLGRNQGFSGG